jgi:hypothetical protein
MGTLGLLPGLPTEEEEMQAEYRKVEVDTLAATVRDDLDLAEDMSSSLEVVLWAYARALRGKFSARESLLPRKASGCGSDGYFC